MIFNKKIKMCICAFLPLGIVPCVFSCSTMAPNVDFNISIDDENTIQFSNSTISKSQPVATFPFHIENAHLDDVVSVNIDSQEMDGESGVFLSICRESHDISLKNNQKDLNIQFSPTFLVDVNEVHEIHFSISCSLTRHNNIIFKKTFKDLYFENATATTFDMFSYETESDGSKILTGWNQEEWVAKQVAMCNVLLIPNDVTEIADEAFCKTVDAQIKTTIPENIKLVSLNENLDHLGNTSNLTRIGDYAFYNCNAAFHNLILPTQLSYIGEYAFWSCSYLSGSVWFGPKIKKLNKYTFWGCNNISSIVFNSICSIDEGAIGWCENLQTINVASFKNNIPNLKLDNDDTYWDYEDNFNGIQKQTLHQSRHVYLCDLKQLDAWKTFFKIFNENFESWMFFTIYR